MLNVFWWKPIWSKVVWLTIFGQHSNTPVIWLADVWLTTCLVFVRHNVKLCYFRLCYVILGYVRLG